MSRNAVGVCLLPVASCLVGLACLAASVGAAHAEVCNIKVVTDANPDYSDMESMVRSITGNWKADADKMWALFYWDHIARRQTQPIWMHGYELTDPIRQFNDYGYTMCSTICGIKCSVFNYMGYPCRFWEIGQHTVPDVWYEGRFHHYDSSLSTVYTLPDGKTIASVEDIGATMAGPETDGKPVKGYIGLYHCVNSTSPNGYLEGADTERPLTHMGLECFNPRALHYQFQYYGQDRGHRYILNLRDGETYTRYYARRDANSPNAVEVEVRGSKTPFKTDPAYCVPNIGSNCDVPGKDPELAAWRLRIRGNGERVFTPILDEAHLAGAVSSAANIKALNPGLQPAVAGKAAEAVFKVEGANVITSLKIRALLATAGAEDAASIAVSVTNGLQWKEVWKADKAGDANVDLKLINEVNGSYEILVKVALLARAKPEDARLKSIAFEAVTEINSKTQPMLHVGRNTVYVGTGEQTESIVYWPDFRLDAYKAFTVDTKNVRTKDTSKRDQMLAQQDPKEEGYVVFRVDAPTDITSVNYGGRLSNRGEKSHIDFLHSFDGGKTWKQDYSCTDTKPPWDIIHYETVTNIPAGTRSVLLKYSLFSPGTAAAAVEDDRDEAAQPEYASLYAVRMEVNHKLAAPSQTPVEATFAWSERQQDYTLVKRSHTQLVDHFPMTYAINVGGADHPIVDSLTVNLKGARPDVKYGYSDGKDAGGEKWVGTWATYGKNLAVGKPYTISVPSGTGYGAGDPNGKKLTDGRVGSPYIGGTNYKDGLSWGKKDTPEIVVDLGEPKKCAAFRIHMQAYPEWDDMKGENKDKVEVQVSNDGKEFTSVGNLEMNLRWKDLPENFMWPDREVIAAHNYFLPMAAPVEARYVKYKLSSPRGMNVSEVQVLESFKFEPFDLRIALPDPASNGKAPFKADISPNAKKWAAGELPKGIIGVKPKANN